MTTSLALLECEGMMTSRRDHPKKKIQSLNEVVRGAEKSAISKALRATDGNREKAVQFLGIALRNLYYKIKKYGLT